MSTHNQPAHGGTCGRHRLEAVHARGMTADIERGHGESIRYCLAVDLPTRGVIKFHPAAIRGLRKGHHDSLTGRIGAEAETGSANFIDAHKTELLRRIVLVNRQQTLLKDVKTTHFNPINDLSSPTVVGVGKELVGFW